MAYFPMYIELENKNCLIIGGGKVAQRKVKVLQDFGANVTVIALSISEAIRKIAGVTCLEKHFTEADLDGADLVVAATDSADENHQIATACKERKIPVNAVDQVEDCTFIFPSYVKNGEVTTAITSGGNSPVITQYLKKEIQNIMPENIGEMAEALGSIRDHVKESLDTEAKRKAVYTSLLTQMLEKGCIFSESDVEQYIEKNK